MCNRILVAIVIAVFPFFAHAQPLADRVPADALLYIGWQGSESMPAAYARTNIKGVLEHSTLLRLCSEAYPKLIQRVAAGDKHAAQVLSQLDGIAGPLFCHPSALFLLAPQANAPIPIPRFALSSAATSPNHQWSAAG